MKANRQKKRKGRGKSKGPTQLALANDLGVSRQLIAYHLRAGECPPLTDRKAWVEFLAQKGRSGSAPPELRRKIAEKRLAILEQTRKRMARENEAAAGLMMPTEEARRQAAIACSFLFAELERGERELPPAMAGQTAVEIFKRLHGFTEALRKAAKDKFNNIGS